MGYEKNLRQIVNLTLRLVNDYRGDFKNGKSFTVQEVTAAVNDYLLELVMATGAIKSIGLIVPTEDTQVYNLPADCLRPLQLKLNGMEGTLILPKQVSQFDYERMPISDTGDPVHFFRDKALAYNQIGFHPTPGTDGSTFTRDSDSGLLRRVSDGTNNLTYDANRPLRRVTGVPVSYTGDGQIARRLSSTEGNILIHYVRNPARMEKSGDYPDSDFPTWTHKDMKWGAAEYLLRGSRIKIHILKRAICMKKSRELKFKLQERIQSTGQNESARPF